MRGSPGSGLQAFTYVYDRLMQDQERYYSGLVAHALGVPIHFLAQDDYRLYDRAEQLQSRAPDPLNEPFQAITADQLKAVGESSRIALTGDGGDPVFCGNQSCLTEMLSSFRVGELVKSAAYFWLCRRRPPRLGIRTLFRRALGIIRSVRPEYPTWLNSSFETRYELRARWEEKTGDCGLVHPRRPETYESLTDPLWQQVFVAYSPDLTHSSVDVRYPFFDVRLLRYMLRVPSLPWCSEKLMLRVAMQGMLPEQVRMRRKTRIVDDPILVRLNERSQLLLGVDGGANQILEYVDRAKANHRLTSNPREIWVNVRPISLSCWLSGVAAFS
jgi:asparagine synthase (glutamine-hydrolysing)